MKIAVVGAGVSGLTAAHYLSDVHDVTVFEANNYLGGHTDTHSLRMAGKSYAVDTGFIVFNYDNYPNFSALLKRLNVGSRPTEMSFSVQNLLSGLEYNASNLNRLFCQRRNLLNPFFYRMLYDLVRFYRQSPALLDTKTECTLGEYLDQHNYSKAFINEHLIPMACALWSGPSVTIRDFPARYFVQFMHNHRMLSLTNRPQWRVVAGGSKSYVDALIEKTPAHFHTSSPVSTIHRNAAGVTLSVNGEQLKFDKVVIATHSDQALRMLEQPSATEIEVLRPMRYQKNDMLLHSDTSILPTRRQAWASWNVRVSPALADQCTVSYHMNTLQGLDAPVDFIVSLNANQTVDPSKVYLSRQYMHPIYTNETLQAQQRWAEINGEQHTYYCGAYWGWGFHEDGVKSALRVVDHIQQTQRQLSGAMHVA